jgi:cytochrome c553
MGFRRRTGFLIAIAGSVLASSTSWAQEPLPAGNAQRGSPLANTCLGCHGIHDYKNAYPNYRVPKLEGQHAEYLASALKAYRSGERSHLTMHSQASSLSDQDIADVAAYFAGQPVNSDNAPEGKAPAAAQVCVACHGTNGVGITPQYPTLAGQHPDYLVRALTEYKKGGRKNPIMAPFASQLNAEQMAELAEYYSKQMPALKTEERPDTRLTAE